MSFDLKNAVSTYQRMMTRMFEPQLGKVIEVYIDNMVVKSKVISDDNPGKHPGGSFRGGLQSHLPIGLFEATGTGSSGTPCLSL